MGSWKLEVFRMAIYLAFPVGLFHYFNQPQLFEDWVTQVHRELYPPDNNAFREQLQALANERRMKEEKALLKSLEELEKKND